MLFPFISPLPWKKRDEKGETMLRQPGHLDEQLSLDPQTPGPSEHTPRLLEKQRILCFKEAPP